MKKLLVGILAIMCILSFSVTFAACGEAPGPDDNPPAPANSEFAGVTFDNMTVNYDGLPHILAEVSGAPEGTTIVYDGRNEYTDCGVYPATAKLSKEGYNDKTLTATLTINGAEFTGVSFEDKTVDYDGQPHTITATFSPSDATVTYTNNGPFTEAGTYQIGVKIEKKGYTTVTKTAVLTIRGLTFSGVSFEDKTVDYDGQPHTITATFSPSDATVTYTNNGPFTEAGTYQIGVKIEKKGYTTVTKTAVLTIRKLNFSGITLESKNFDYDGNEHIGEISVKGTLPANTATPVYVVKNEAGVKVSSVKNAGRYSISVVLTNPNYNSKTLTATYTINKLEFTGITLEDVYVNYDGKEHVNDIRTKGVLPQGTDELVYKVYNSDNILVSSAIDVGIYTVKTMLKNPNYNTKELTATLRISAVKKDMPVISMPNGTSYFANGLDDGKLYSIDSNGKITKINSDKVVKFVKQSNTELIYISSAAVINSVKKITQIADGDKVETVFSFGKFDYVTVNGDMMYYSVNNITSAEQSGIYRVDLSQEELTEEKIFTGKTKHLSYYNGFLYFTNGNDNYYIYKMNVTDKTTSIVLSEKVHEFIIESGVLYCCVNTLLNDYIGKINLNSETTQPVKLTNFAGEYLTYYNGYIYFNNTDLSSSALNKDQLGIWKVSVIGTYKDIVKVMPKGINSLSCDYQNNRLLYIDAQDLHLYSYDTHTKTTEDLLDGFVAPETTPYNKGGKTSIVGNDVYFLNMYADKTLYKYNQTTRTLTQLTSDKVEDFYIYDNYLYFNQVTRLVNNDLYKINLTIGGLAEKVSSDDCREMVSDGTYLYYVHYNAAGAAGGLGRMKTDGTAAVKFSEVNGASSLKIKDGKLYYLDGNNIYYYTLSEITDASAKLKATLFSDSIKNCYQFEFVDNYIYYSYRGTVTKEIRRADFDNPGSYTALVSKETDPIEFIISGNDIYYFSQTGTALNMVNKFWKVNRFADDKDGSTKELVLDGGSKYYGSSIAMSGNKLYFLNGFYFGGITNVCGDAHFYVLDVSTKTVDKIC